MSCAPTKHILLDFEGVVSAERRLDAPNSDRYRVTSVHLPSHGEPFTAVVDDVVIARLNALAQLPGVTIHWLTCVGFHVPRSIAPALGFDDFPNSVHTSDVPGQDGWPATNFAAASWWKAVAARRHLAEADSVLWVDDHINAALRHSMDMPMPSVPVATGERSWWDFDDADDGDTGNESLSSIVPSSYEGLTLEDLDAMEDWAVNGTLVRRDADPAFSRA